MLNLNLLSPEEKVGLAYLMRRRAILALGAGLAGALAVFAALLLPTIFSLAFQLAEAERAGRIERERQDRSGFPDRSDRIREVNRWAEAVSRAASGRPEITPAIRSILDTVPPAVRLSAFTLKAETGVLSVEGFSPTRQDFLSLLDALRANPRIAKVSSPVQNLIRETDIRFSINATLGDTRP